MCEHTKKGLESKKLVVVSCFRGDKMLINRAISRELIERGSRKAIYGELSRVF